MTALIITALSIIVAALAYRLLRVLGRWFDEIVLAANDVPDRRDDALGEVGEGLGEAFDFHNRSGS
jgi:biopolymer transport protein ExbB/TolQ